jgi:hypothetical protein
VNRALLLSPVSFAAMAGVAALGALLVIAPGQAAPLSSPEAAQAQAVASAPAQAQPVASETATEARRTVRVVYSGVITAR